MTKFIYLLKYTIAYTHNGITEIMHKEKAYNNIEAAQNYGINYNSFGIPNRELIHFEISIVTLDFEYKDGVSGTYKKDGE